LLHAQFLERHQQVAAARTIYEMLAESGSDVAGTAEQHLRDLRAPDPVEQVSTPRVPKSRKRSVLIVGAGTGGRYLLRDLDKDLYEVIGFVDDLAGEEVNGIPVLGTIDALSAILPKIDDLYAVFIAIPTLSGARRRAAVDACLSNDVRIENLPSMFELDIRRNLGQQMRNVRVEEVLGDADMDVDRRAGDVVRGRNVLVTGAGSTIGREISRQAAHARARLLALSDVSDDQLLEVWRELRRDLGFERAAGVVDGVDRPSSMKRTLELHQPEIVFHAASRNHMELMEDNTVETVRTNTLALLDFARACGEAGVQRFVLVGNHHAGSMRGVMDTSKLLAEHLLLLLQEEYPFTDFLSIRVGNLYRAQNSVVKVFEGQIERGGPVTVVRDAERRFMRIELAAQTVLQIADYGGKGKRYAMAGGEKLRIADLAELIIRLRGYRPGDIDVETISSPHAERQNLDPFGRHERRTPTDIPSVSEIVAPVPDKRFLLPLVDKLREAVEANDPQTVTTLVLGAKSHLMSGVQALA